MENLPRRWRLLICNPQIVGLTRANSKRRPNGNQSEAITRLLWREKHYAGDLTAMFNQPKNSAEYDPE